MKLRIGIIGAGGITWSHLPHLVRLSQLESEVTPEIVAVADINPQTAQTLADEFGIARVLTDWHELLPIVDAVLICVPTHLHAPIATEFLRAGKAVFCEKPMARTLEAAAEMKRASQESGAPLQIGLVRRFDDEWKSWRDAILDGKIGRPVVWHDVASGAGPGRVPWFFRDEQGGGPFLDGCIHNFDFALWTFGPAQWVFCHGRTLNANHSAIDTGTATVCFQSGDEMMLAWSWGLAPGIAGTRVFEFLGPQGLISLPAVADGEQPRYLIETAQGDDETYNVEPLFYPPASIPTAFGRQMEEFVQVAAGKRQPRAGIEQGEQSLALALAVLESARSGQVVTLSK